MIKNNYDIIIAGAGITGLTMSILLNRSGIKVAIIEKGNLSNLKAGESLTPDTKKLFELISFPLQKEFACEFAGIRSSWGAETISENNFITNPYGNGVAVDRIRFEKELARFAMNEGIDIFFDSNVKKISSYKKNNWTLTINHDILNTEYLVFAGGRSFSVPVQKTKRNYLDNMIGVSLVMDEPATLPPDQFLYIESTASGWMYTNLLPGNKRIITVFTDNNLTKDTKRNMFSSVLNNTKWITSRNDRPHLFSQPVHTYDARTSWLNDHAGDGWVAIGDTVYAIDPLSGQGIKKNLEMAMYVCHNIKRFISNDKAVMKEYRQFNKNRFSEYWDQRIEMYTSEQRFLTDFWKRRAKDLINQK